MPGHLLTTVSAMRQQVLMCRNILDFAAGSDAAYYVLVFGGMFLIFWCLGACAIGRPRI